MAKEKIIMIDVYGMEHVFDNTFEDLAHADQWAHEHDMRVSRKYTEKGAENGKRSTKTGAFEVPEGTQGRIQAGASEI